MSNSRIAEVFEPVDALVRFFKDGPELRLKLGACSPTSGRPIVRPHRACGSAQLSRGFLRLAGLRQLAAKPDDGQRK